LSESATADRSGGEHVAIARNAASAYGARALLALSVLLITPYLFRRLGTAGFGTWSVMFTVTTVFNLLEFGFSAGVTKFVAEFRAQPEKRDELNATLGAAVTLMALLGLLAAGISVVIALLGTGLAAAGERGDFRAGMIVLGAAMVLRFPFVAYAAALMGYQRYDLYNVSQAITIVGFAAGAVAAVESGAGVLGLAVAYGLALVAGALVYGVMLARIDSDLSMGPRVAHRPALRRIGGFSSLTLLADSMVFIGQRMDTVVIAAIRNAVQAAPFAAALKLQTGLQSLTMPFVNLLMPMMSDLKARGRHDEVVRRFIIATRVAIQITLPVAVGFALFAPDIVKVWLGPDAPTVTIAIIVLLMSVQSVTLAATPAEKVLVGVGKVRTVAALALIEGISNLGISIALVSAYGAIGAALGTLFTSAVLAPLKFPLACRATGCEVGRFFREGVGVPVASGLPGVLAMLAVWAMLPSGAVRLLLGITFGVTISGLVAAAQVGPRPALAMLRSMLGRSESPAQLRMESQPVVRTAQ
jgi:O-antigen/teichoic acid export membrane protein